MAPKPKTILVVEDNGELLRALVIRLSHAGFEVVTASDGAQALECAKQQRIDAITLDLMSPNIDGIEVASLLHEDPKTTNIPIALLTGTAVTSELRETCRAIGVRFFIRKPFDKDRLAQFLKSVCSPDEDPYEVRLSRLATHRQPGHVPEDMAPTIPKRRSPTMEFSNRKSVLVVDDDRNVLTALDKKLSNAGFLVLTGSKGVDALECATEHRVDAIILDVHMPGAIDGLRVASALRQNPPTAQIPIIFVTGVAGRDFKEKCKQVGGEYFLSKPYDDDVLIRLLNGIFAKDELGEMREISLVKRRQPVSRTWPQDTVSK